MTYIQSPTWLRQEVKARATSKQEESNEGGAVCAAAAPVRLHSLNERSPVDAPHLSRSSPSCSTATRARHVLHTRTTATTDRQTYHTQNSNSIYALVLMVGKHGKTGGERAFIKIKIKILHPSFPTSVTHPLALPAEPASICVNLARFVPQIINCKDLFLNCLCKVSRLLG